ncbi:hypothetical protein [Jannaschia marina]|uniref:hypothetical protein n=1 Tax=Jannaschia marina TaxID=2741674 RepID=UPI0015CA828D|nr:hypothetical protein [Jannaschia marina]
MVDDTTPGTSPDPTSRPLTRIGRFVIPAVVAAVTTATTVAALDQRPDETAARETRIEGVTAIEFTTFTEAEVTAAIADACVLAGCDTIALHPMITAYAGQMDAEQLRAARWAQMRLLARGQRSYDAAAPGSNAADLAFLELASAARIAHHYTQQLASRR